MTRVAAFLCLIAFPAFAEEGDPVTEFSDNDVVMNKAIANAQATLPLFLCESVDAEGYGPQGGYLKVRIPTINATFSHENIWVGPFAAWSWYAEGRKAYGDYTTRVILRQLGDTDSLAQLAELSNPAHGLRWSCE